MSEPIITPYDIFYTLTQRVVSIDECCSFISYKSFNDNSLDRMPINYPTTVRVYKQDCCNNRELLLEQLNVLTNTPFTFDELTGDGTYYLEVSVYDEDLDIDYSVEFKVCANCCEKKRCSLIDTLKGKMASLSCKINDYKRIGKKTRVYDEKYLKLSNMLYVLDYSGCWGRIPLSCDEVELLKCSIAKII